MNRGDCGGLTIGVALGRLNGCGTGVGVGARTGGFRGGRNAVGIDSDSERSDVVRSGLNS